MGSISPSLPRSPLVSALEDAQRGRLVEALFGAAGPRCLRGLFREHLRGRLLGVATHRLANHGLQRLLDHAPRDVVGGASVGLMGGDVGRLHPLWAGPGVWGVELGVGVANTGSAPRWGRCWRSWALPCGSPWGGATPGCSRPWRAPAAATPPCSHWPCAASSR